MALKVVDMVGDCNKKKRCLFGPNEGLAYTPGDECESGYEFNSATCDCESPWETMRYRVEGTKTTMRFCCNASAQEGCPVGCSGEMVPGWPQDDPDVFLEEDIIITRDEWDARYSTGVDTNDGCNTFETFATLASAKTWRGPGIRIIGNGEDFLSSCPPGADITADADACIVRCDGNLSSSYISSYEVIEYDPQ